MLHILSEKLHVLILGGILYIFYYLEFDEYDFEYDIKVLVELSHIQKRTVEFYIFSIT